MGIPRIGPFANYLLPLSLPFVLAVEFIRYRAVDQINPPSSRRGQLSSQIISKVNKLNPPLPTSSVHRVEDLTLTSPARTQY